MVAKIYQILSDRKFQIIYKFGTLLTILIILYFQLNYNDLIQTINLSFKSFILSILILFLLFIIIYFVYKRWDTLLKITGNKINKDRTIIAVLYGNMSSELNFLGIFLSRTILIIPEKIILKDVIVTTIFEKILSAFFLLFLTIPGIFLLLYRDTILFSGFSQIIIYAIIFCMITLILTFFFRKKIFNFIKENKIYKTILTYISMKNLIKPIGYTICIQLLRYICLLIVPIILGIEINYDLYIFFLPIIIFFSVIPVSISPWGWRELIFILVMKNIDLTSEESFAISIFYGFFCLINSILAVLLFEIYLKYKK